LFRISKPAESGSNSQKSGKPLFIRKMQWNYWRRRGIIGGA
jgi:hypothetical protein